LTEKGREKEVRPIGTGRDIAGDEWERDMSCATEMPGMGLTEPLDMMNKEKGVPSGRKKKDDGRTVPFRRCDRRPLAVQSLHWHPEIGAFGGEVTTKG